MLFCAAVTFLTLLTQLGGVVLLFAYFLSKKIKTPIIGSLFTLFIGLYVFATFVAVPILAPFNGRERVKHIQPTNQATVWLNRNYVVPNMNHLIKDVSKEIRNQGIELHFLDANFPFVDGFPLLPHLSHNDGRKLDLSLIYETAGGEISKKQKSVSGYGVFSGPTNAEYNQIRECIDAGYFQYDYPKYVTFGEVNQELVFSEKGTKMLVTHILKNDHLERLFIEPHLKERLQLSDEKIRFHGCRAVRHDDHIHIQVR